MNGNRSQAIVDDIQGESPDRQDQEEHLKVTRIAASHGWVNLKLKELWDYRELLYFLTWRDLKVRYKQTALGAAWVAIQPLLTMVVFSIFFGKLAQVPSDGIPYPLFAFGALVPWTLFAYGLSQASTSLTGNTNLLTKVYFPRLTIPIATVLSAVVDFLIGMAILLVMAVAYGVMPTAKILWLPLFTMMAVMASLGTGLWLSALNVTYRDVRYIIPFLTQLWMYGSPIAYPSSLVPEPWRAWYGLNPMVGVVDGFRWALLGKGTEPGMFTVASAISSIALLWGGVVYFRRMEKTFADRI